MSINNFDNVGLESIGLRHVEFPLTVEFWKTRCVVGFDINEDRLVELKTEPDSTLERDSSELSCSTSLEFRNNINELEVCNCFIEINPVPINESRQPDWTHIIRANETVEKKPKQDSIVIHDATLSPKWAVEVCVSLPECFSTLLVDTGFLVAHSFERVSLDEGSNLLSTVKIVTSTSTSGTEPLMNKRYQRIITACAHNQAPNILGFEPALRVADGSRFATPCYIANQH